MTYWPNFFLDEILKDANKKKYLQQKTFIYTKNQTMRKKIITRYFEYCGFGLISSQIQSIN